MMFFMLLLLVSNGDCGFLFWFVKMGKNLLFPPLFSLILSGFFVPTSLCDDFDEVGLSSSFICFKSGLLGSYDLLS